MDSSFSLNSPDDDVSPSDGVKLQFGARDYDEIFAGSSTSSIPEIDVSDMRERVGLGGARGTENVEYASIFSGFDDNDVAIPYEEFSGTGKNEIAKQKTKAPISIGEQSLRESSSQHPPKNARFLNKGSSDQPIHEYRNKQRISVSLNRISPSDYGESNGKADIEQQAHAVPRFTYSVNGNTQPENAQGENCTTLLRCDVSRTWSFIAEVESVKAKEGKCSPSHLIDQSYNVNEGRSRISDFHSEDASEKISADLSFPFFDEELDGNLSAAALKKAIEQAQECIRLAKSTMERKREGLQDEPKTDSPINVLFVQKASDDHDDDHHKENNASFDPVIPMFSKVDDKFAPAFCSSEELFYAKNAEVEKVRQVVGKHEVEFNVGNEKYATLCRQDEKLYATTNVKVRNTSESIDLSAVQTRTATEFVANETGKTANSESSVVEHDGLMCFIRKGVSHLKEMATGMSPFLHRVTTNSESKDTEVVTDLPENHEAENFNECLSKLKFAVTTNMPNESRSLAEEDVLDLEKTKKMSELTTGLKENCNAYVKSCDDEDNKVLDEEDEEWFESEVQLKEEEISEKEPEIYLEVELDALRPHHLSEGDVQKPLEDHKLNETAESRMCTSERGASEAEYSHLKKEHKETEKSPETQPELETGQNTENNKVNPITKEDNARGYEQRYDADDVKQRIEAIKRGRERQKEQIAVERAIREARERAFVDAQQRAMAEAQRKVEREGRAAVERATAEARERALQKAMSMKNSNDARTKDDAHSMERFSSSSRNNGLKHSFSSSDLDNFDGTCSESTQRRKARLEREQRIRERMDKALAEKNKRDRLVQKEQAERNRLSASLDAEIKRWSSGKEGNLRALLSTLQYILGPKSGWQPISLTEMITAAAVKKAYRKATLYVHPDKLQQRGATVRQKYVCEKVFDLLKAAWNRFNSEER